MKKGKEFKSWESITADMMSDEEKRGDTYVRHQPDYRSLKFTAFLDKLDERSSRKQSKHARYKRSIGTPVKVAPPAGTEKWVMKSVEEDELPIAEPQSSSELDNSDIDDSDNSPTY